MCAETKTEALACAFLLQSKSLFFFVVFVTFVVSCSFAQIKS